MGGEGGRSFLSHARLFFCLFLTKRKRADTVSHEKIPSNTTVKGMTAMTATTAASISR